MAQTSTFENLTISFLDTEDKLTFEKGFITIVDGAVQVIQEETASQTASGLYVPSAHLFTVFPLTRIAAITFKKAK